MEYASINSKLQYLLRETPRVFDRLKIGCPTLNAGFDRDDSMDDSQTPVGCPGEGCSSFKLIGT